MKQRSCVSVAEVQVLLLLGRRNCGGSNAEGDSGHRSEHSTTSPFGQGNLDGGQAYIVASPIRKGLGLKERCYVLGGGGVSVPHTWWKDVHALLIPGPDCLTPRIISNN